MVPIDTQFQKRSITQVSALGREVVIVVAALWCASCGCDASTCDSTEIANIALAVGAEELADTELTVCRNGDCQTGSLGDIADAPVSKRRIAVPLDGASASGAEVRRVSVNAVVRDGEVLLECWWWLRAAEDVKRGDVLSAAITNQASEEVFAAEGQIASVESTPTDSCNQYPCRMGSLELTAQ